jgi:hypothetical protein
MLVLIKEYYVYIYLHRITQLNDELKVQISRVDMQREQLREKDVTVQVIQSSKVMNYIIKQHVFYGRCCKMNSPQLN